MNWKKGTNRLVWIVSLFAGIMIFIFGSEYLHVSGLSHGSHPSDPNISFVAGLLMFGFVWLVYGLAIFVYKGFQENNVE